MKKQIHRLDFDDEGFDDQNIAYLFFHTTVPGYVFVDDMNHLYGLSLSRLDDMQMADMEWPLYIYRDGLRQLDYYLIERPACSATFATHWAPCHKMLLIKGENAVETATRICGDFSTPPPPPDPCNPAEVERHNIITTYQEAFTPVTIYDMDAPATLSKKVMKERGELENLFTTILDHLDLSGIE